MENKNKELIFTVYNSKCRQTRDVLITPRDDWGNDSLLGTTIRYDKHKCADDAVIRILSVEPHSPGAVAELQGMSDYVLGTPEEEFENSEYFLTLLSDNIGKQIPLYVYNCVTDEVRKVFLTPSYTWGGRGCAGIEIGSGLLHHIPTRCRETVGRSCIYNPYINLIHPHIEELKKAKYNNKYIFSIKNSNVATPLYMSNTATAGSTSPVDDKYLDDVSSPLSLSTELTPVVRSAPQSNHESENPPTPTENKINENTENIQTNEENTENTQTNEENTENAENNK